MKDFSGVRVIVTAAANGIGRATAMMFGSRGAHVIAIDREGAVAQTAVDIQATGGSSQWLVADCTDEEQVRNGFGSLGAVDVLVNAVGGSARGRATEFWNSEPAIWAHVIQLSLVSAMLCARQVVPIMRERRSGRIINIASDAALRPQEKMADYGAAKAGVIGFTRALALELAPFHVTVNAVSPGVTVTRGFGEVHADIIEKLKTQIPMQMLAEPDDIANAILFFASVQARYITGQTLAVNGGRSML